MLQTNNYKYMTICVNVYNRIHLMIIRILFATSHKIIMIHIHFYVHMGMFCLSEHWHSTVCCLRCSSAGISLDIFIWRVAHCTAPGKFTPCDVHTHELWTQCESWKLLVRHKPRKCFSIRKEAAVHRMWTRNQLLNQSLRPKSQRHAFQHQSTQWYVDLPSPGSRRCWLQSWGCILMGCSLVAW